MLSARRRRWLPVLLLLSTTGTICRSSSNPGTVGSGNGASVWSEGTGTFSGADASGARVNATISGAGVYLDAAAPGPSAQSSFLASDKLGNDDGIGGLEFSNPAGAIAGSFAVNIALSGDPLASTYTAQSTGASGGVALAYATASTGEAFSAGPDAGSWTLVLTSVAPSDGGLPDGSAYESVHGTLSASLTDGHGGSGTLQLTF